MQKLIGGAAGIVKNESLDFGERMFSPKRGCNDAPPPIPLDCNSNEASEVNGNEIEPR